MKFLNFTIATLTISMDVLVKFYYKDEVSLNGNGSYENTINVSGQEYRWLSWSEYCNLLKKKLRVEVGYINEEISTVKVDMERITNFDFLDFVRKMGTDFLNSTNRKR
jgi:hypothetical protein